MSLRRVLSIRVLPSCSLRSIPVAIVLSLAILPTAAQSQVWIRQLGTSSYDDLAAVAPDGSGGVYASGRSYGNLGGTSAGSSDIWLARYDGAGSALWIRQIGTNVAEWPHAAAPDGSGGVFVSGITHGKLAGTQAGGWDAWVARYDGAGNQLWIRQFGMSTPDWANAAAPDGSGGVYLSGSTWGTIGGPNAGLIDAWLARFDGAGNRLWARELGTSAHDRATAAAPDGAGGVYVSGFTAGSLGGASAGEDDAWLTRYDGAGNRLWARQLGTATYDLLTAAAPDGSGGVYVSGYTYGSLGGPSAGGIDPWLAHYDGAGNLLWTRQLGTSGDDYAYAAAADASGGVYVVGDTPFQLGGLKAGWGDPWLARYDSSGNQVWIGQFGSSAIDMSLAASSDGAGGVYLGGSTQGSFGGPYAGQWDAWLARHDGNCPASSIYCTPSPLVCQPVITAAGLPSASAGSGFHITATSFVRSQPGLFLYGTSGQQAVPFQGGTLCVKPPLGRTPLQNSGGKDTCGGKFSLDFNAWVATGKDPSLVAGAAVDGQYWCRNPLFPPPNNVMMTAGLHFVICP